VLRLKGWFILEFDSTLLTGVLPSIQPEVPHTQHAERRHARSTLIGQATIIPAIRRVPASPMVVLVRDLSPSGVCIITRQSFVVGDRFLLLLQAGVAPQRAVLSEVKHWRPLSGGLFAIGAQFMRMIETIHSANGLVAEEPPASVQNRASPVEIPVAETIRQVRETAQQAMDPAELAQLHELEARLASLVKV
jgi:hypothetical protein